MKQKVLVFHVAVAPYRIDFFNAVHNAFDANFYFNFQKVPEQDFDKDGIMQRCDFEFTYLENAIDLGGRSIKKGIIAIINKHKPDIILCNEYSPVTCVVFAYLKLFSNKTKLYTISDDSINNSKERQGIRKLVRNVIAKNIDGVIFPSLQVGDWFKINVSDKVKTLELPIIHRDEILRKTLSNSLEIARANVDKYNLNGKIVILFVGRLVEVKNLPFLLKCYAEVNNINCQLVMVGDGELEESLKSLTKQLNLTNKVIFTGKQEGSELFNWYTFSQIFVLPSGNERFGAVVNEALVGGCFTLCSTAAGASSLINENNGLLFDPENQESFVRKLQESIYQAKPISRDIYELRDNLMPFSFDDKIEKLFSEF